MCFCLNPRTSGDEKAAMLLKPSVLSSLNPRIGGDGKSAGTKKACLKQASLFVLTEQFLRYYKVLLLIQETRHRHHQ